MSKISFKRKLNLYSHKSLQRGAGEGEYGGGGASSWKGCWSDRPDSDPSLEKRRKNKKERKASLLQAPLGGDEEGL